MTSLDPVQAATLAADIREALANVAEVAWRARDAGLCESHAVELVLMSSETFVQSLVRAVNR